MQLAIATQSKLQRVNQRVEWPAVNKQRGEGMELTPAQITEGMIFYGVKSGGDYPEFVKYQSIKATNKQVKAKKVQTQSWGANYEYTLRGSDWRYFTDFISARAVWVATVLDADIKRAEDRLIAAQKRKASILADDDL